MPSAGGHVPTHTAAPASWSAFAIANPRPPSSATPATNARFPDRSMLSMGGPSPKSAGAQNGKLLANALRAGEPGAAVLRGLAKRGDPGAGGVGRRRGLADVVRADTLEQQSLPTVHVALSFAHAVPGPASARLAVPALCSVERQALSRQM